MLQWAYTDKKMSTDSLKHFYSKNYELKWINLNKLFNYINSIEINYANDSVVKNKVNSDGYHDPVRLGLSKDNSTIIVKDGRHRILAAKKAGNFLIPAFFHENDLERIKSNNIDI